MEYVTLEEINEAYMECRKKKRRKSSAIEYELDYEQNNYKLWRELNDMTYEVGESVAFCVTRPKLREVFAADFRDRVVHHLLIGKFLKHFEESMIDDSYNCRKGKGTTFGIRKVKEHIWRISNGYTKEAWVMKCDIEGFFMSIDRDVLWGMLEGMLRGNYHGKDIEWWLWRKVVYNRPEKTCKKHGDLSLFEKLPGNKSLFRSDGRGLPIGNLTSQILANFYLSGFDKWATDAIGEGGYGRFVDDFVVVHKDKDVLLRFADKARVWLKENLRAGLHKKKFYLQEVRKGLGFVGAWIKPGRIYTGNRTVDGAFRCVAAYNSKKIGIREFVSRYNSYMGFLVRNNSYGIRWNLWNAIVNKNGLCCVRMKKLIIVNNNSRFVQKDADGRLVAEWREIKDNELHQNNSKG